MLLTWILPRHLILCGMQCVNSQSESEQTKLELVDFLIFETVQLHKNITYLHKLTTLSNQQQG